MSLYYDSTGELREIDADLFAAWVEAGNPKAEGWTIAPPRPADDAVWNGSGWTIPPPLVPETVTARQARLWLIRHGITLAQVDAVIATLPDPLTREIVRIEWEYGTDVRRSSETIASLGAALALDSAKLDQAFREAATL